MSIDLTAAASALSQRLPVEGARSSTELLQASIAAARSSACVSAFVREFFDAACHTAEQIDAVRAAGGSVGPLGGLPISIKDLFDVQEAPTTAGSAVLAEAGVARKDSPAVARVRAAGGTVIGHTNMTEFAFSGLGLNPHHGTPANPATAGMDNIARIPGGSTSGGAVSVAAGAAWAALGSDTGGSIRIPAAFCGLVGFKNTQRLTPLEGTIPLSTSLDTACAITLSVRDAVLMHEVLSERKVALPGKPVDRLRLALPRHVLLDGMDSTVSRAFERSLAMLRRAGATIVETTLQGLETTATVQALAGIVAAEAWAWHRELLSREGERYDPRVATRVRRGGSLSAADYIDLLALRRGWQARMAQSMEPFDAVICPTVPIVAPPLAPLQQSDETFMATNALVLRNPSVVNQLDGCAISLPCHASDQLPVGLMLFSTAMRDDALLDAALQVEAALAVERGA